MKKLLAVLLATIMTFTLFGCGSNENNSGTQDPATEKSQTLDLTGTWVQENGDDYAQIAAVIRDDGKIGLFYIIQGEDVPWVYWIGTYDAPKDNTDEYSWVSENTYGGDDILASSEETKEFTYKNGDFKFPMTIEGQSGFIHLVRGEWDTSKVPESVFNSVKEPKSAIQQVEIKDSGWCLVSDKWVMYYVVLHNPNKDIAVEYPAFRITARDANGVLLGTEDQTLSVIYPGHDFVYGSQAFSVDEMPATVDFEVLEAKDYNLKNVSLMDAYKPLEVVNAGLKSDKLLGEIKNPNNYDLDDVVLVAIFRNSAGELVNAMCTFVDDVKAGGTTPFSKSVYLKEAIDSIEFYANRWD